MSKEMGERITEIMLKQNITQKKLAEIINLNEPTLSRYINGLREPKPDVLANIATTLHTTSDYLLGIETDDFNYPKIKRLLARNANKMSSAEKRELINALFEEE